MSFLLFLTSPLLLASAAQAAEIYKCTGASGKVEFTDAPCGTKQAAVVVDARPNTLSTSEAREQALKIENKALQEKLAAAQSSAAPVPEAPSTVDRSGTQACRNATRDLEFATSSIEKNRALIRARQSAMYAACGLREPDRQITNINVGNRADRPYVDPRTSTR